MGNVAAWRYFRAVRRESFNVVYHVVFPLIGTAALVYIGYKSIVPLPAYPVWIGPLITAVYVVAGLAALAWARRPARAGWRAGPASCRTRTYRPPRRRPRSPRPERRPGASPGTTAADPAAAE